MKRFYQEARSIALPKGGFAITLDGKFLKTSGGRALILTHRALAYQLAEEWQSQGEEIIPASMFLFPLVNAALDLIAPDPAILVDELTAYGRADLLCYRATHPRDLAERQALHWQPWLDWAASRHGITLAVTEGVLPIEQPRDALYRLHALLAGQDIWRLAALRALVPALGSVILALALSEGSLDAGSAFNLAWLDEGFQVERWGDDDEARQRRENIIREIEAAAQFLALLKNPPA